MNGLHAFFKEIKFQELMTAQSIKEFSAILTPLLVLLKRLNSKDLQYGDRRIFVLLEIFNKEATNQLTKILN